MAMKLFQSWSLETRQMTQDSLDDKSDTLIDPYEDLADIFGQYWIALGGWREIIRSPYVHITVFLTVLLSGYWMSSDWQKTAISVLPNLLGFGVTGYAIWIGWGDEKLREQLTSFDTKPDVSAYVEVSAIFAHFAFVQIAALLSAIIFDSLNYVLSEKSLLSSILGTAGLPTNSFNLIAPVGAAIGFFFFIYAIVVTLEATLALFRLATWFQKIRKKTMKNNISVTPAKPRNP
jgi:hypothetical protein